MLEEEAKATYRSLQRLVGDLERNLGEGESIGVQSNVGPEFYLQTLQRNGTLVMLVGDTMDGDLEEIVFSPSQVALRFFTSKRHRAQPIGFGQTD